MKLIKHYDFTSMTSLHPDWNVEVGDKWFNEEVQQYHNHPENLFFQNGLVIQATLEDGIVKSARINTKDNFKITYGKIEMTCKLPNGKGTWPAFWMMPNDAKFGRWPRSGEIDIMEHTGKNVGHLVFCLHTEAHNHKNNEQYYSDITVSNITEDFHTFGLLWEENKIEYYFDDEIVATYIRGANGKDSSHKGWPFTEDFYFILNLAIGGWMGGPVDYTSFPQQFIIKEIKVFQ